MPNNIEKIVLPRPMPEKVADDDAMDQKNAGSDADFDDMEIEIDVDELEAEKGSSPSGGKH